MPTILLKKSDTPGSVPGTANLTNLAGGVEVAVNTADKRVYSMTSASAVIELGTNPSSLTCSDVSATVLRSASATITNLIATSASITTLTNNPTFSAGTANGVLYLNGSKVATSGSALTFDGTNYLNVTGLRIGGSDVTNTIYQATGALALSTGSTSPITFNVNLTERMRLTSSVLSTDSSVSVGIGTTSPTQKLTVAGNILSLSAAGTDGYVNAATNGVQNTYLGFNNSGSTNAAGALNNYSYVGNGNNYGVQIISNGSAVATFTNTGNLGIGVTPSASWQSGRKAIQLGQSGVLHSFGTTPSQLIIGANNVLDGTNYLYLNTGFATMYNQTNGVHSWFTAPSGTAGNTITGANDFVQMMTLDASGNLGVGTTSPSGRLHIATGGETTSRFDGSRGSADNLPVVTIPFWNVSNGVGDKQIATIGVLTGTSSNQTQKGQIYFSTSDGTLTERARITSGGDLLVATTTTSSRIVTIGTSNASISLAGTNGGIYFGDAGSPTGSGGFGVNASIARAGGTNFHITGSVAGDLCIAPEGTKSILFGTSSSASSVTERARITSGGNLLVGTTDTSPAINNVPGIAVDGANSVLIVSRDNSTPVEVNRKTSDGTLIRFWQDGTLEGDISVSGTTVSYNGGHLSRWSQTTDNTRIPLLKGTVMSNLDQMAVWEKDGQPLPNEQLNCMKVSDVEGDVNVAGVFVNWDNDDQDSTNDMNVAMTGDMIIRIAQGVVVQRGDLLMSAGDGTAKPQGDDIIRSKTVAKVTSNHVTCTYDDGSYCVPCVLMAC